MKSIANEKIMRYTKCIYSNTDFSTPIDKAVIKQQMRKQFFSSSLLVGETIIFEENASRAAKQMKEIVMHHMRVR